MHGRPFVFLKLAMSLDGRIATRTGHSKWITSETSRRQVHRLRDRVAGVMIGIGTALADNPSLTTRLPRGRGRDAERIIVDSSLRIPPDSKVINSSSPAGVIIACSARPPVQRKKRLEKAGVKVLPTSGSKRVNLRDVLSQVYGLGITSILIEGGSELAWSALSEKIVDRCLFYYATMLIGGENAPSGIRGTGVDNLEQAPRLTDVEVSRVGPDILVSGRVFYQ
jgi:diaminohydroxyphosphoribosylaminopyrimidine deaminase/5-amino-6-(5-phosphoribosylamino)uracil reductase